MKLEETGMKKSYSYDELRTTVIRTTEGSSVPTPQSTRPWLWVNTAENFDIFDFER